jgi:hypothetical protein
MGSTLEFKTGFAHGRRQNALAEGASRSPAAKKRVAIIRNEYDDPKKKERDEKEWKRGQLGMVMD